ncbi:Resolvase [Sulfitobacter noctilucae]|uniref:recombinase family protein n=1 Tax=Sulfitobacter noctilucae TaxID=1342302 RepID=UPI000468F932|nr:recombinase family protein [Sulfitobacter noctilucae]KIN60683.1 Resolvase [Sulfitobacter noctilucae]
MGKDFVTYFRVSTARQGESKLGLDAQKSATDRFVARSNGKVVREFIEVESGKRNHRPKLEEALSLCIESGATLLIAKLDRLARNVHFISGLLESKVRFVAVDMPNADRFMLHVYAAMAEEEARRISERTISALQAAKARGVRLGENAKSVEKRNSSFANDFSLQVGPLIEDLRNEKGLSFREVAEELNRRGIRAFRGGDWHPTTTHRTYKRFIHRV